jgi:hypothetical protein
MILYQLTAEAAGGDFGLQFGSFLRKAEEEASGAGQSPRARLRPGQAIPLNWSAFSRAILTAFCKCSTHMSGISFGLPTLTVDLTFSSTMDDLEKSTALDLAPS